MAKNAPLNIFQQPAPARAPAGGATLLMQVQQAMLLHQQGRIPEAAAIYTAILRSHPNQAECLHYLGVAKLQTGQHGEAVELIRKSLQINGAQPSACSNLGLALQGLGRSDEALASYERALSLDRRCVEALNNRAGVLRERGRLPEALRDYDAAIALRPNYLEALRGRAITLARMGRHADALAAYDKLIALKRSADALNNRGVLLRELNRLDEALHSFEDAIRLQPDDPDAWSNKGALLSLQGDSEGAAQAYARAIELAPASAGLRLKHMVARIPVIRDATHDVGQIRERFAADVEALKRWLDANPVPEPLAAVGPMPFYLAYQELNNRPLLEAFGQVCCALMAQWSPDCTPAAPADERTDSTRIRIGIVSAHIREHPVWTAIVRGWFQQLDPERFELHVFYLGATEDAQTAFARTRSAAFHAGPKPVAEWAAHIASARLDVLIYPELGMDDTTLRLAATRLAPAQAATWGHPETTGLPTIDVYLSSADFEGDDADACYTERLVRLSNLGCYYEPDPVAVTHLDLARLGIRPGVPLLVCPGSSFKYAPEHDRVFIEIVRRLGDAQFLFFTVAKAPALSARLRQRLADAFAAAGLDASRYLVFAPWQSRGEFYSLMEQADVFLDTIGFSGFNTAMQAVDCALPIVTMEGRFMRGKFGSAILKRIGLGELVHATHDAYIASAARLASDPAYRKAIREAMVANRHVLYKDTAPVRDLEAVLEALCAEGAA